VRLHHFTRKRRPFSSCWRVSRRWRGDTKKAGVLVWGCGTPARWAFSLSKEAPQRRSRGGAYTTSRALKGGNRAPSHRQNAIGGEWFRSSLAGFYRV
jgi:hypothetical protein